MQTLEAMMSLLFFLSAASMALASFETRPADDSLYRLQLAEDAWRVLYLRGNFRDLDDARDIEPDMTEIGEQTGLCLFIDGIEATNCRGGTEAHEMAASVTRTAIYRGEPATVTFSIGT